MAIRLDLRGLTALVATAVLGTLLPTPRAHSQPGPVTLAVIVARDSKVTNVSSADLARIFRTEKDTGPDGRRVVPINHPPKTSDRMRFDQLVLGMSPDEVGRFWIDRRIRGGKGPPKTVDDLNTLKRVVASLDGAVAYVRLQDVTANLKAITVDGKRPNDPAYPIRGR